ncbi:MAG: RNA-binding cell elongation regulator Jag/EloR [Clostridia bacterium]
MRSLKVSGKTIDEAIFKGLNELEISIDEVNVKIIQNETKGVFGFGSKPAIVLLTERENDFSNMVGNVFSGTVKEFNAKRDEPIETIAPSVKKSDEQLPVKPKPTVKPVSQPRSNAPVQQREVKIAADVPKVEKPTPKPSVKPEITQKRPINEVKPEITQKRPINEVKPVKPEITQKRPINEVKPIMPIPAKEEQNKTEPIKAAQLDKKLVNSGLLSPDMVKALESGTFDAATLERRNKSTAGAVSTVSTERVNYPPRNDDRKKDYRNDNRRDDRKRPTPTPQSRYGMREPQPLIARPAIPYSLDMAKENETAKFLSELLVHMGFEAQVLCAEFDDGLRLKIDSKDSDCIIGHRGETLNALQYLTSLNTNRARSEGSYIRVTIDAQGYREKREETLMKIARIKASDVKRSGKEFRFEPMNPYERRVIHSALQNNAYVTTHSEGMDPNRRVVIAPK